MREKNENLLSRVRLAKETLRKKNVKSPFSKFCNEFYGKVDIKQAQRLINLWTLKISDEEFTENLESFIKQKKT